MGAAPSCGRLVNNAKTLTWRNCSWWNIIYCVLLTEWTIWILILLNFLICPVFFILSSQFLDQISKQKTCQPLYTYSGWHKQCKLRHVSYSPTYMCTLLLPNETGGLSLTIRKIVSAMLIQHQHQQSAYKYCSSQLDIVYNFPTNENSDSDFSIQIFIFYIWISGDSNLNILRFDFESQEIWFWISRDLILNL